MKTTIFNLLLAGVFISGVALTGCSKSDTVKDLNNNSQQLATRAAFDAPQDAGILNQDLRITYASDNGADITQEFQEFTFRFAGNYPGGEAQVWNDLLAQLGTWSSAEQGAPFSISYPTSIFSELVFLNRTWTVTEGNGMFTLTSNGDEVRMVVKKAG